MLLQCVRTSFKWGTSSENPNLAKLEFSTIVKQKIRQIEERLAMLRHFLFYIPGVQKSFEHSFSKPSQRSKSHEKQINRESV